MQIVVIGATGFIGFSVSQALVRAGHDVYGITRSIEKSRKLATEEITPIVAEAHDVESWKSYLFNADAVIDALSTSEFASNAILRGLTSFARSERHPTSPKLTFVYCSGGWVHSDSRTEYVSDTTPTTNPVAVAAFRVPHEQATIKNNFLNGIVVRPTLLYGRSGSELAAVFKRACEGSDDLANFFLKVVEKSPLVGGITFDASNSYTESVDDFLDKLVRVSGANGPYTYYKPTSIYEEAMAATTMVRPHLGRTLLGWHPVKASLVDGLETWYAAWKASAGL